MQDVLYIILPALLAGIAVSISHIPLGKEVLKQGIIFIDLAIAQIAALGVIIAKLYLDEFRYIEQILAFVFSISAAYFFMFIEKKTKNIQEAVIGCSFVVAISVAMLLVDNNPHGDGKIEAVLTGQILWASWDDIIKMFLASILVLVIWFKSSEKKRKKLFYPLFAICVTFSVQLVGVYLVFASLIFPALVTFKLKRNKLFYAYVISFASYSIGIISSYHLDLPTSPAIILTFVVIIVFSILYKASENFR